MEKQEKGKELYNVKRRMEGSGGRVDGGKEEEVEKSRRGRDMKDKLTKSF